MADRQFNPLGTVAAPGSWTLPPGLQILLKGVYAEFDGTGAAGSFQPAFEIQTDSGHTQGVFTCGTSVAAGGSADVTWFRGLGAGGSGSATPAASAYLTTFVSHTFTGSSTYTVTWPTFQTTDLTVFGTNAAFNANTPTHNQANDFVLVLLKDGAYCLQTTLTWQAGTVNAYAGIQNTNPGYAPIGNPNATNNLPTTTPAYSGNGALLSQDTRLLTIPAGEAPAWFYLEAAGQTATNYTMTQATFLATWFGSGIGTDNVVY